MDPQTTAYVEQLVRTSLTAHDPNQRRQAASQAQQILQVQAANGRVQEAPSAGRPMVHQNQRMQPGPSAIDPLSFRGSPQSPTSMVHLDQVHPPILGQYITPMVPPSRVLTVPGVPLVPPGGVASDPAFLDFTAAGGCDNGLIIGMHGCAVDNTAGVEAAGEYEYATMEVQITFNDSENIITDGEAASFVPYCDLFSPGQRNPFPIMRAVSATDKMFFRWRNTQPLATGNSMQPSLTFLFLRTPYPGS